MINIAVCTDENFSIPALVCITSVFENNKEEECYVYVLNDGLSNNAIVKFEKLASEYKQQIIIKTIDKHRFDGLTVNERFPISMYYRYLLPEILPKVDKILYLDCDIIVRHSLNNLFETQLGNKALAAVVAESCDDIFWTNLLKLKTLYFNSGVLLINLDYWRKFDITNKLIKWVSDNPHLCNLPDQNALNKVLEGNVVYLDYTYNFQEWWFGDLTHWIHYSRWADIQKASKNPVVVHFCEAEKPWFKECKNPFKNEYLHYAYLHEFIGFHLLKKKKKEWSCTTILDRIGLKFRYWAELWQKKIIRGIRVS